MRSYFLITPASQDCPAFILSGTASPGSPGSNPRIQDVDSDSVCVKVSRKLKPPYSRAFMRKPLDPCVPVMNKIP
jgi:hypothetical protein